MKKIIAKITNSIKSIAVLVFLLMVLIGARWIWSTINATPNHPLVTAGVLDMRGWDFKQSHSIALEGEWEFYPEQFLTYTDFTGNLETKKRENLRFLRVPGGWSDVQHNLDSHPAFGYGTYRLRILLDQPLEESYGFWIQRIRSSSEVEINGATEAVFGEISKEAQPYRPESRSYTATYKASQLGEIELLVRVANYSHPQSGGIVKNIRFGSQAVIDQERWYSIGLQLATFLILMLHVLYACILYYFNPKEKALPIFILLLLAVGISIISDHDSLLLQWLPLNHTWALKIKLLSFLYVSCFMVMLIRRFNGSQGKKGLFQIYGAALLLYTVFILLAPTVMVYYSIEAKVFSILYLLPMLSFCYLIGKLVVGKYTNSLFLLFTSSAILSSVLWGVVQSNSKDIGIYYPFDLIAALIGFSAYWFKQYFRNAEENVKLNLQLREADKRKDEFLANTAHELRTPLHGIINLAQSIVNNSQHNELVKESRENLGLLVTISRRMSHIVNDLLDLSRLQDQRISLQRKPMSVNSSAAGVADMLRYLTEGKPVVLTLDIPDTLPLAFADEKRIVQVLLNLMYNAIKFTEKGTITISAKSINGQLLISVADTGIGIAEADLERIFLPYENNSNDRGGIGLGLSISKHLVEMHEGILSVKSRLGQGSEFSFTLPVAATLSDADSLQLDSEVAKSSISGDMTIVVQPEFNAEDEKWVPLKEKIAGGKLRILAVDDDPVNLKVLTSILSSSQFDVTTANSGLETLELLASSPMEWDLLIADVMMPQMSGYELTRKVRERFSRSELPILLLTARVQSEDIYTGFSSGANDYTAKPVDALELQYRVWSLATLKRSANERLKMEAAYLQAQIRPHFIFNALNAIMALSEIDTEKMRDLGESFSTYLRISFNAINSDQWVKLGDELDLVRAYLLVEKARFEERLSIVWEVEVDLNLPIPPLILQPLVENAVNHGLLKRSKGGELHIRIMNRSESTLFEVRDNGIGMEETQIRSLLNSKRNPTGGIGVTNTNLRLLQRYGQGLAMISVPGEGTVVSFEIPNPALS